RKHPDRPAPPNGVRLNGSKTSLARWRRDTGLLAYGSGYERIASAARSPPPPAWIARAVPATARRGQAGPGSVASTAQHAQLDVLGRGCAAKRGRPAEKLPKIW